MLQCCASLHISLIHELTPVIPQHHKLQPWALLVASCCGWHGVESSLHRWVSCNLDSTGSGHYTTFGRTTCPVSRLHFGSLDVWPISMTCFPIWPHLYWVPTCMKVMGWYLQSAFKGACCWLDKSNSSSRGNILDPCYLPAIVSAIKSQLVWFVWLLPTVLHHDL